MKRFEIGQTILLTYRHKSGYDTRIGHVFDINYNGNGLVTYTGSWGAEKAFMPSGSGAFDPNKLNDKKFGLIAVCII